MSGPGPTDCAIVAPDGTIKRTSRNLRGMRNYARVSPVVKVETDRERDILGVNPVRGSLVVTYADGCTCTASFASHAIMIDFVRNRRTWRGAQFVHKAGNMGYLTKPGVIAGGVPC